MRGTNQHVNGWTTREDDILFAHYEQMGSTPVMEQTGRSRQSVNNRARYYGLKANRSNIRRSRTEARRRRTADG